jgi:Flp pilus assembly protein TadG
VINRTKASVGASFLTFLGNKDGVVLVTVAILLSAIIVLAGLAVEAGLWYAVKRQNQSATDAAALAAALEYAGAIETGLSTCPTPGATICPSTAATTAAQNNGFSTTAPNTITVGQPSCPSPGKCIVQVVLDDQMNTLFGRASLGLSTVTIATAATGEYQSLTNSSGQSVGQSCLIGLGTYGANPPSGQVIRINGHADFDMPNCTLASVSTDSGSILCNGCSAAGSWDIAGIATAGGMTIHGQTPPVPIFTQYPVLNPYASVTISPLAGSLPTAAQCTAGGSVTISAVHPPLQPGCYTGLSFTTGANVVLDAGLYYIDGGSFSITDLNCSASISGTGVTIVLTHVAAAKAGDIDIDPGATACNGGNTPPNVSLSAPGPAAGLLKDVAGDANSAKVSQGLLIFQDPTAVNGVGSETITTGSTNGAGTATVTLSGAIVAPDATMTLQGNPVAALNGCTELIAKSFLFGGTPQLDDSGCNPPGASGGTTGGNGSTGVTINQAIVEQVFLTQ